MIHSIHACMTTSIIGKSIQTILLWVGVWGHYPLARVNNPASPLSLIISKALCLSALKCLQYIATAEAHVRYYEAHMCSHVCVKQI